MEERDGARRDEKKRIYAHRRVSVAEVYERLPPCIAAGEHRWRLSRGSAARRRSFVST